MERYLPLLFLYHLCINLPGLLEQSTTDWVVSTIETYFLPVLEASGPRSSCQQAWFLGKPLCLVWRWLSSPRVFPWSSRVCVCLLGQVSVLVHGLAPTLSNLITSLKLLSSNTAHSEVLGSWDSNIYICGCDTVSP